MSCLTEKATPQEMFDKYKDMFSNIVLKGGSVVPESNEWYVTSLLYAMSEEFTALSEQAWQQNDPRYACCEKLYEIAAFDGVYPRAATSAEGFVRITGQVGAPLTSSMQITFGAQTYIISGTIPAAMPAPGYVAVRVQALVPGANSNVAPSTVGFITNPPAGIDAQVSLYNQFLCGGKDAEQCEEFRQRYLQRISYSSDFEQARIKELTLEYPCVTDVFYQGDLCCLLDANNNAICSDKLYMYVLFQDTFPCGMAPQCVIDDLNTWLFGDVPGYGTGKLPFGICGEVLFVRGVYVNIRIDGLSCVTPARQREVINRVTEYVRMNPPSTDLKLRTIETIVTQVVGDIEFEVVFDILGCSQDGTNFTDCSAEAAQLDQCGDVTVSCDYKVCINEVMLVNTQVTQSGCL